MKIVLASSSPRRKELLKTAGIDFEVDVEGVEEIVKGDCVEDIVCSLAEQKCSPVALRRPSDCVIGADTVVALDGKILGKPKDIEDAKQMLRTLSGNKHAVFTGVCISAKGKKYVFCEKTEVTFFDLTEEEINSYVSTGEPMDKAGAYGIQGYGCTLVEKIDGDYFNVVGLPVAKTVRAIRDMMIFNENRSEK